MENSWNDTEKGKWKHSETTMCNRHSVHHKFHKDIHYLGPNPGLSSERTTSNRLYLIHGTAEIVRIKTRLSINTKSVLPITTHYRQVTISNHDSECTTFHCSRQGGASCGSVWRETVACRPLDRSSLARTPTHSRAASHTLQTSCHIASL